MPLRSGIRTQVLIAPEQLANLGPCWKDLAERSGLPGAQPAWQLAWWRHLAPERAVLRVVVVRDDERVLGIVPCYAVPLHGVWSYGLLAAPVTHRVEPLAEQGATDLVAEHAVAALARCGPRVATLELAGLGADSRWPAALAGHWPAQRGSWTFTERVDPAPALELRDESFDAWLAAQSRHFRERMRRARRQLTRAGGTIRLSSLDQLAGDVGAFERLHHSRHDDRGGSTLGAGIGAMLIDAGATMVPDGTMQVWVVELDGRIVSVQVTLVAGEVVMGWNGGFDSAIRRLQPAIVAQLAIIEACFASGKRVLDYGGGDQDYKRRFANADRPLAWRVMVPRERTYLRGRAALLPRQGMAIGRRLVARLPPEARTRLRSIATRLPARR